VVKGLGKRSGLHRAAVKCRAFKARPPTGSAARNPINVSSNARREAVVGGQREAVVGVQREAVVGVQREAAVEGDRSGLPRARTQSRRYDG